ncbi:hypothetical protein PTR01_21355 [Serratia bockelmannii]|uniref:hypothetical protein n=1 Tax=Serratia bockelmannii TaxID=2703793 RepID=UPI00313E8040
MRNMTDIERSKPDNVAPQLEEPPPTTLPVRTALSFADALNLTREKHAEIIQRLGDN